MAFDHRLWIFGGSDDTQVFNDLNTFSIATNSWLPAPPPTVQTSTPPAARRLHTAVLHFRLDEDHRSATTSSASGGAAAAAGAGAAPAGEWSMIIFGGYDGKRCMNDMYKYSFTTHAWSAVFARGTAPTPRFGHSAVVRGNFMYIFGGYGAGLGYRADCYKFDILTSTWSKVIFSPASVAIPNARRCHAAAMTLGDSVMLMVGGSTNSTAGSHLSDITAFKFLDDGMDDASSSPFSDSSASTTGLGGGGLLGMELGNLLDSENPFTDVTFTISDPITGTAGKEELKIKAHRAILAARSPVFDRLFRSSFSDSASGSTIAIQDCSAPSFKALLRFLYTGSPKAATSEQMDPDVVLELLALAERYMVPSLKKYAEKELLHPGVICPANCCGILIEAERYNCPKLKQTCLDYIARKFNSLKSEAEFTSLPQPLLLQIMTELAKFSAP